MVLVVLLLPALAVASCAAILAALWGLRIAAVERTGGEAAGGRLPLVAVAAIVLAGLLLTLPWLYLVYELASAPPTD